MLSFEAAREHLRTEVKYKPGWKFFLDRRAFGTSVFYELTIIAIVQDSHNPDQMVTVHNRQILDPFYVDSIERLNEFIAHQIQGLEFHEVDEWFKVSGEHYREPHPEDLKPHVYP